MRKPRARQYKNVCRTFVMPARGAVDSTKRYSQGRVPYKHWKHLSNWPTCLLVCWSGPTACLNVWSEFFWFAPNLRGSFSNQSAKINSQIGGLRFGFLSRKSWLGKKMRGCGMELQNRWEEPSRDNENCWINKMRTDFWLVCFANLFSNMM